MKKSQYIRERKALVGELKSCGVTDAARQYPSLASAYNESKWDEQLEAMSQRLGSIADAAQQNSQIDHLLDIDD